MNKHDIERFRNRLADTILIAGWLVLLAMVINLLGA
jgi:hypothetical protein